MSTVAASFIIACGCLLVAYALCYGYVKATSAPARWAVYVAVGVIACQFVFVPVLPLLGLRLVSVQEQYWACAFLTVGFHLIMDRVVPLTLKWESEEDDAD